ncbi:hypothetical protein [Nocardioides abyssi]|uniref:LppX_LprAFG lipoprotein n=1 Tax=Nocardioides abyssi TaxID=3058370 RepID=A0ABT8EU91_9ACTN|nr:hypothetical protein [Nocardioides abyssi]MDN4161742.1 hypothetical protein [Nocardioides abyssi]
MTRRPRTRRLLAAVAVAPLLSAALVACGGDGDSGEASDPAVESSATTDADEAAETEGDADAGDLEEGQEVTAEEFVAIVTAGVEESTTATVTTSTTFGGTELSGTGVIDYTQTPVAIEMDQDLGGSSTKVISVDGIAYINLGELSQGKFWKVDPSDPDGPFAALGMGEVLQQSDPVASLQAMEDGIEKVTYVGEEDVDGRDLDHFEMTVDLASAMKNLGSDIPKSATKGMPEALTYDVWLDEEGRFGRMVMDMPVMGQSSRTEMTIDDWGSDVSIEAPPASEVTDMPDPSQMMGQMAPSPTA